MAGGTSLTVVEQSYYIPIDGTQWEAAAANEQASERSDFADAQFEYFQPTPATKSVWAGTIQHGGPPMGLLTRAMGRLDTPAPQHFSRITTEILGAVGLGVNRVRSRVLRPGKQISLVGAELQVQQPDGSFRAAARATGWRLRAADTSPIANPMVAPLSQGPTEIETTLGIGGAGDAGGQTIEWGTDGFIGSIYTGITNGRLGNTPAVWLRPAIDLVAGETMSDLESIFTVIDVANGVGSQLNPAEWTWMNTDTTVHLATVPTGPWVGIDAQMAAGADGFGATYADLFDQSGFIGRSAQTVLLNSVG